MDRTERFYKIEMLIRSRGSVPFAALMDELGVSRATLKRDLEYLRERLAALLWVGNGDEPPTLRRSGAFATEWRTLLEEPGTR